MPVTKITHSQRKIPYLEKFLHLQCSTDVLNTVNSLINYEKEPSMAMSIIRQIKTPALKHKGKLGLFDVNAGKAVASVLAAHLLPLQSTKAISKDKAIEEYGEKVNNFFGYGDGNSFEQLDCRTAQLMAKTILISSLPTSPSVTRIMIDKFNENKIKILCFVPEVIFNDSQWKASMPKTLKYTEPDHGVWCFYLSTLIKAPIVKVIRDRRLDRKSGGLIIYAER